jgi:hypothetical protein
MGRPRIDVPKDKITESVDAFSPRLRRSMPADDYMDLDEDVVWRTATQEIGPLILELERLVPPEVET